MKPRAKFQRMNRFKSWGTQYQQQKNLVEDFKNNQLPLRHKLTLPHPPKKKLVEILSLITATDRLNPPPSGCEISGEIEETSSCPPPEVLDNSTCPIFSEGGKNSHPVIDPPVGLQPGHKKEQNCSGLSSPSVLLANLDCPVMNVLEGENSPPPSSSILEDARIENHCANDTSECLENHGEDNGESAIEEAQQTSTSAQTSTEITQCSKIFASESILASNPHLTASSPPSNISANLVPPSTKENANMNDNVSNIQSEQSQSRIGINIQKDTGGNLTILEQDPTFIGPTKSKKDLTIIVDPDLRIQLYKGFHFFQSGLSFLTPSTTEPWFHSEIIDFQLLLSFGAKSSNNPGNEIIPVNKKTNHPESTLVRFLYQLQTPSRSSIQVWARIVAVSIETVTDKLNRPAEPTTAVTKINSLPAQIQMIQWLSEFKKSGNFGKGNKEWPNSMQVVKDFYNQIINLMISFSIFQAQAHAKFKAITKKKKSKKNTSSLTTEPVDFQLAKKKLSSFRDCHNFQPFILFLVGGDTQSKTSEEKIWKNVYAYIHQLLLPAFRHPDEIPEFQPPTIHQLAEAVATDFISH
ncbi:hypothetical protein PPACK8108_LOCUS12367 [Phakopsora pachyrhizi]|uniref:Uncharacterized protein n=1 Tax=Phakopsora pachyrhizi TaxID=170000 RepID=A0AAV0B3Z2_PHAPC|nr:hypothetical protein PPACK8108_LOCUS12367 [Phakopsora pachyrhizi]